MKRFRESWYEPMNCESCFKLSNKRQMNEQMQTHAEFAENKRVIVILENASLEVVKLKTRYQLLSGDEHRSILRKKNLDMAEYRPDITHQCLLTLLDSPLNKSGHLQVYIHTKKNQTIEVSPHIRIPRTYKRFAGLMVQLLRELSIRSSDGKAKLLKIIPSPVEQHFPPNSRRIGTSSAGNLKKLSEYIPTLSEDEPIVFAVGAMAHGNITVDYVEEMISFSEYSLSASVACSRLCNAYEELWDIF